MTPTDELREAVARVLEDISIDAGDHDGWGAAPCITPETAHETADRIIRLVVAACEDEARAYPEVWEDEPDAAVAAVRRLTAAEIADRISALAPKEPEP